MYDNQHPSVTTLNYKRMKQFPLLLILCWLTLAGVGCDKLPERTSTDIVKRTITAQDTLRYDLGEFSPSEQAYIQEQARHAAISTLDRDTSRLNIMYYYAPLPSFSGSDFVEIQSVTEDNNHPGSTHTVITRMTIEVE
jgi:hypothetical protein